MNVYLVQGESELVHAAKVHLCSISPKWVFRMALGVRHVVMLSCCRPPGVEGEDGDEAPPGEEPSAAPPAAALSGEAHLLALLHMKGIQAWG